MKHSIGLVKKGMGWFAFGMAAAMLIAGCGGGGGGSGGGSGTAVSSYMADEQGSSFNGNWYRFSFPGSATSAVGATYNLNTTPTPGNYVYIATNWTLTSGSWASSASTANGYDLAATGWVLNTATQTFVDKGDGINISINNLDGAVSPYSVSMTSLAGTAITCTDNAGTPILCTAPGNYPAGAKRYTRTLTTNTFWLQSATAPTITDSAGVPLTALPAVGSATICHPLYSEVFQPAGAVGNYNVFSTTGCSGAAISTATAGTAVGTVQIATLATGNTAVPNVLLFSGWTGPIAWRNSSNSIIAVNLGSVYPGLAYLTGNQVINENKIAINAELAATAYPIIP